MRTIALVSLAVAGCASGVAAQDGFAFSTVQLPPGVDSVAFTNKNVCWLASDPNGSNTVVGGSVRSQVSQTLTATGTLQDFVGGNRVIIVQEQGTNNFWGLGFDGRFTASPAITSANPTPLYGQDIAAVVDGDSLKVFNVWTGWTDVSLSPAPAVRDLIEGRSFIAAVDGQDLVAVANTGVPELQRTTVSGVQPAWLPNLPIPGILDQGEPRTRTNAAAFRTGSNEITIYSSVVGFNAFSTISDPNTLGLQYDKFTVLLLDQGNNILQLYSAITGTLSAVPVADVNQITTDAQDVGVFVADQVTNRFSYFRGIDGGLAFLQIPQGVVPATIDHTNNTLTVGYTDGAGNLVYNACSASVRGAQFVSANVGAGEVLLNEDGNDMCFVLATDSALYGFSGFTNSWTRLANYQGAIAGFDAEDHFGRVVTDQFAYGYNPRLDLWVSYPISANASVSDTDSSVWIVDGNRRASFSMNGDGFVVQNVVGTVVAEGSENNYNYTITDDGAGGSNVYFYNNLTAEWTVATIGLVTDPAVEVIENEDGLLVLLGSTLHAFSGRANLSPNYDLPTDNYAYNPRAGNTTARFVGGVRPNAQPFLLLGSDRIDQRLGRRFVGSLKVGIPGAAPFVLPLPTAGADGVLEFDLPLANAQPGLYYLQVLAVDPGMVPVFGDRVWFQVF